jgi:hypothetical protein
MHVFEPFSLSFVHISTCCSFSMSRKHTFVCFCICMCMFLCMHGMYVCMCPCIHALSPHTHAACQCVNFVCIFPTHTHTHTHTQPYKHSNTVCQASHLGLVRRARLALIAVHESKPALFVGARRTIPAEILAEFRIPAQLFKQLVLFSSKRQPCMRSGTPTQCRGCFSTIHGSWQGAKPWIWQKYACVGMCR